MLSMESSEFDGAVVTFTRSTGGTYVWTGIYGQSLYAAMNALRSAIQLAFGGTWTWAWTAHRDSGGVLVTLGVTGVAWTWSATVNTAGGIALGWPAGVPAGTSFTGSDAGAGTWYPGVGIALRAYVGLPGAGDAAGPMVTRPGNPASTAAQATLEAIGTGIDASRLALVMGRAANPRRGYLWQTHTARWYYVAVGQVGRSSEGESGYRFTLEVAGRDE